MVNHLGMRGEENIVDVETRRKEKRRTWPEDRRLPIEHITRLNRTRTDVGRWFALQILQFFRNSLERHFELCRDEVKWVDLKETYRLNFIRTEPREMKKTDSREKPRERETEKMNCDESVREREKEKHSEQVVGLLFQLLVIFVCWWEKKNVYMAYFWVHCRAV